MSWLPVTTWQYRWQDKQTMDEIARGGAVGLFSGKPLGRPILGNRYRWKGAR